jgi:hypothetical protein
MNRSRSYDVFRVIFLFSTIAFPRLPPSRVIKWRFRNRLRQEKRRNDDPRSRLAWQQILRGDRFRRG